VVPSGSVFAFGILPRSPVYAPLTCHGAARGWERQSGKEASPDGVVGFARTPWTRARSSGAILRSRGYGIAPLMAVIWPIPEASRWAEASLPLPPL
jgi:hypothetical protein